MNNSILSHACILLFGVFISSVSQVMLKKAALKTYKNKLREYFNFQVIFAYVLFVGTTILAVLAYREIPLSMGMLLETSSYLHVTIFGVTIFKEKMTKRKVLALGFIIVGIMIYSVWG